VSFRAKRGTPQKRFDRTNDNARSFIVRATVFDARIGKTYDCEVPRRRRDSG